MEMVPIRYRQFWDFAREFIVRYRGVWLWFNCEFDESLDDYEPDFHVHELSNDGQEKGPWSDLAIRLLGTVPTNRVTFDATCRQAIQSDILEVLGNRHRLW